MKILKAKIKKSSKHYKSGLNHKEKPVWLEIVDFKPSGEENYKVRAIKAIKSGFPVFTDIWISNNDLSIKEFEDGQYKIQFPE